MRQSALLAALTILVVGAALAAGAAAHPVDHRQDNETGTDGLTRVAVPASTFDALGNASAAESALAAGTPLPAVDGEVAYGATLLVRVESPTLAETLRAQNASNATAALERAIAEGTVSLSGHQTPETTPPEAQVQHLNVSESFDNGSIRVAVPPDSEGVFLALDTGRFVTSPNHGHMSSPEPGIGYNVTLAVNRTAELRRHVGSFRFTLAERTVSVARRNGVVRLDGGREAPIRGNTSLPGGVALTLRLVADDDSFQTSVPATVAEDGSFAAQVTESLPENATFTLFVDPLSQESDWGDAQFPATTGGVRTAAIRFYDQRSDGRRAIVSEAVLSDGGFVALRGPEGRIRGNSSLLEPGYETEIAVDLGAPVTTNGTVEAIAYRDSDGDGQFDPGTDRAYRRGGTDVGVGARLRVVSQDANRGTTDTSGERTESPTATRESPTATYPQTTSHGDGPGFRVLGTLVAGTAFLLLVARGGERHR